MSEKKMLINIALPIYLGAGRSLYPSENIEYLIERFGRELAYEIQPEIDAILYELSELQPDWKLHKSLKSATDWAGNKMRLKHPELNDAAVNALKEAFSWWWK